MKQAAATTTPSPHVNTPSSVGATIGMDIVDTTWRIAVPVLLFAVAGIIADRSFDTAPWVTLPATVVGFVMAGLLVKRQIAAIEAREKRQ